MRLPVFARLGWLSLVLTPYALIFAQGHTRPKKVSYSRDVKPILAANCISCHAGSHAAGGLDLQTSSGLLKGGDSGVALLAGKPETSRLLQRIEGKGGLPLMPKGQKALDPQEIAIIRNWIAEGAKIDAAEAKHWAYIVPVKAAMPASDSPWIRNPIDAFVLDKMHKAGLHPSPEAPRETLIRRLTLDLTGLPPSLTEIDEFLADKRPDAYERVVDRLLASPHYGERMALPWLDAARYADSNGFQQDGDNYQYVWRDWVVQAFNRNMPFDEFAVDQLAGDLLPNPTLDQILATAFNRCHMLNGEGGAIPEEQRNVILFDRVDVTATTFLGLTMGCARCHDHKYDPLTQCDYYSMLAYFNQVPETGVPSGSGQYRIAQPAMPVAIGSDKPRWHDLLARVAQFKKAVAESAKARSGPDALKDSPDQLNLKRAEKELADFNAKLPQVMVMSDAMPRKTHIYFRGNYDSPLGEVHAATPAALTRPDAKLPSNRLGLARWIVSPENPLTSRVQVNRIWQMLWGRGLVKTAENFGVQCEPPVQQPLLDWLAVDFREHGWNVKRLIKMIVMSSTYRQNSKISAALRQRDPENQLLARGTRFRISSLFIRDVALSASGLLNPAMGGKPVYPYQPKGIWDGLSITNERDFTYPQSKGADLYRRSLYTFWRRTVGPANMFDAATRQICTVKPSITSTPLHALTTLNDPTWVEASRVLAEHLLGQSPATDQHRINEAFLRACARRPAALEMKILQRSLDRARAAFRRDPEAAKQFVNVGESPVDVRVDTVELASYESLCLAIFNLDEALTRE